jgi:hypothetical protein
MLEFADVVAEYFAIKSKFLKNLSWKKKHGVYNTNWKHSMNGYNVCCNYCSSQK